MSKIVTRMGDGFPVELSEIELLQDIDINSVMRFKHQTR
jgi:hypothetical protein